MVPFAAKFGLVADDLNEAQLDVVAVEYARFYGHDPAGNWILVVQTDNTSEIFHFARVEDMWCCKPDRQKYLLNRNSNFEDPFRPI